MLNVSEITSAKHGKGKPGFTLLELLISMTIMAVVLVLILGALRLGVRAWEKGEQTAGAQQQYRMALDRIRNQLASTVANVSSLSAKPANEQSFVFKGTEESVTFISSLPLTPQGSRGKVLVKYAVSGESGDRKILIFEKALGLMGDMEQLPDPSWEQYSLILDQVADFRFDYLNTGQPERTPFWQPTWNQETENGLPGAVRIRFQASSNEEMLTIIVPIHQENQTIG